MFGGAGGDRFAFGPQSGVDTIWDWDDSDRLDVRGMGFDHLGPALQAFRFTEVSPTQTFVQFDGAGNGVYIHHAAGETIDASDFVVF